MRRERGYFILTRRSSRWPLAIALMIAAAPAAFAQTPMVPDMPPPPPPAVPSMPDTTPTAKQAPGPPGVAAIVNGKKIMRSQVADEALETVGNQVVSQLILIELVNQEAAKQHVIVTPAQVNAKLNDLRAQYAAQYSPQSMAQGLPATLDAYLAQRHQSLGMYKSQLATELKVEALVGKTIKPIPSPLKYHARHLLILTTPLRGGAPNAKPPHTDAEALALIAKAQAELKAGKSFTDVANEYTEDPSGQHRGGDLGLIDAQTGFDANFLQAALRLKPGEVTPTPVKSEFGYHLIKIDSTSAAPTPADKKLYADALAAARHQQVQQVLPTYIHGLAQRAKIVDYLGEAPTFTPAPSPGMMPAMRR